MATDLVLGERPVMFLGAGQVTALSNIQSFSWAFHIWDKGRFIFVEVTLIFT